MTATAVRLTRYRHEPEGWRDQAACAGTDPDTFHPNKGGTSGSIAYALKVCHRCPVRLSCLKYALDLRARGIDDLRGSIWGGWHFRTDGSIRRHPDDTDMIIEGISA